jgi:hypothetical protein
MNIGLMFAQYLSPMIIFVSLALLAVAKRSVGASRALIRKERIHPRGHKNPSHLD